MAEMPCLCAIYHFHSVLINFTAKRAASGGGDQPTGDQLAKSFTRHQLHSVYLLHGLYTFDTYSITPKISNRLGSGCHRPPVSVRYNGSGYNQHCFNTETYTAVLDYARHALPLRTTKGSARTASILGNLHLSCHSAPRSYFPSASET